MIDRLIDSSKNSISDTLDRSILVTGDSEETTPLDEQQNNEIKILQAFEIETELTDILEKFF
ncbi:hypothetical protein SAMN05421858_4328 [Haladaptatus litoreus]|uniref:Uncharacterized protein n=1 Tax=Haladaptatus litoreus TaxID=553468 RepID=A0A1N7EK42_9EURY|nr:hypothetical protein SAMN05421858_4328 [Haladaptatus litoreus]